MQTLTLEITNIRAMRTLQNLVTKNEIRIITESGIDTPALPGKPLSLQQFKQWIATSEAAPTISLKAAKSEWTARKKRLQQIAG